MSANQRGCLIFLGLVVFLVLCGAITFVVLPALGTAAALPVISVPGEAYSGARPSEAVNFTNTIMATLLADLAVIIFAILAWRSSKGWTKEIPGRFQSWAEMVGDFVYSQTKNFAGVRPLARNWLFPLAASIFVFLLAANWMDLLPGVESVGLMHCAYDGTSGYPTISVGNNAEQLFSNKPLNAGTTATAETYEACEHFRQTSTVRPTSAQLVVAANELRSEEEGINGSTTLTQAEKDAQLTQVRLEATEKLYSEPSFGLSADDMARGVLPYISVVTPYVRGAATDLNLTVGLALVSVIAIQVFGVAAQGPAYFQKFINVGALGNISKKPLGAIDFVVGIIEIISEIGKIISLAFRLFGNMFAGAILLAVMSFLLTLFVPMIFYGLELIVTSIQAYVFCVLTIVFSAQAMQGHSSDDHEHHADHSTEAQDGNAVPENNDTSEPITRTAI